MADLRRDQIHESSVALAAVLAALVGAAVVLGNRSIGLFYGVSLVVALAFLLVTAYEPVQDDERYHLGKAVVLTVLFGLWWLAAEGSAVFPAVMTVLGAVAVLVELYNLHAGTSYLRFG